MKTCQQCSSSFEVTDKDQEFYEKIGVPEPDQCPKCRQQNRISWGN